MRTTRADVGTYRDLEAYRAARTLMVDVCRETTAAAPLDRVAADRERLSHAVVSLAMHIVDGWSTHDPLLRDEHLSQAYARADEAAKLIEVCRADGTISVSEAEALMELQHRTRTALKSSFPAEC